MSNTTKNWHDSFKAGDLIYGRNEIVDKRRKEVEKTRTDVFPKNKPLEWPANYVNPITERTASKANLREKSNVNATQAHIEQFNQGKRERHYLSLGNMDKIIKRAPENEQGHLNNMKWGGTSKMGIISAHRNQNQIHYDIEGISPDSVFDPQHQHYDSVTSREMRFIYKHQKTLGNTMQWMQGGKPLGKSPFDTDTFKQAKGLDLYDQKQKSKKNHGHYAQRLEKSDKIDYKQTRSVPKLFRTTKKEEK